MSEQAATTIADSIHNEDHIVYVPEMHLVLAESVSQNMAENQQKYPNWPFDEDVLQQQLQEFYPRLPVLVRPSKRKKDEKELWLYTRSYCLKLSSSPQSDAYTLFGMSRPTLKDHDELARGAVKLDVMRWYVHLSYRLMNTGPYQILPNSNGFREILSTWEKVEEHKQRLYAQRQEVIASPLNTEQKKYLDIVEKLITISQESEKERESEPLCFFYENPEATDVSRSKRDDVYKFHLTYGTGPLKTELFVNLKDNPEIRGKIIRVQDDEFTIRFGREIDIEELDPPGPFETVSIQSAFRVQREAIEALRTHAVNNPYLLDVLVDHTYQDYKPTTDRHPEQLNQQQLTAFQNALSVKDVLLVQGPPGTGKTHTITKIIQNYRRAGQRILVTARTHKAVDNVLEHLQGHGLMILRVGHEDKISYESKNLLIEAQATELQNYILKMTATKVQLLEKLHHNKQALQRIVNDIPGYIKRLQASEERSQQNIADDWFDTDEARNTHETLMKHLYEEERKVLRRRSQLAERHADMCNTELTSVGIQRKKALEQEIEQEKEKTRQIQERKEYAKHEYQSTCAMFSQLRQEAKEASHKPTQVIRTIYREIALLLDAAYSLDMVVPRPADLPTPARFIEYLQIFQQKSSWAYDMLEKRYQLLSDWHKKVSGSADELHPILIRRADVVGATCIGSATAHILADVDFDLIIADEAGQINVLDLLVPLVKGKRTILVGDHQQLPPMVDNDVYQHISANTEEEEDEDLSIDAQIQERMNDMLKKSVFELLFESASKTPGHIVTLTEQHRMPKVIADFVSHQFYNDQLSTAKRDETQEVPDDDLFPRSSLVFIDTADLPEREKQEHVDGHIVEQDNLIQGASYTNPKEADIIIHLLEIFLKEGQEWVVIVPYRAQADYIRTELRQRLQNAYSSEFDENIATVDSFQGGERQKVIYGFTRSNPQHRVGFLSERRRLNVALTRTQQQLILIGDSATLTGARNASFRQLSRALIYHIRKNGLYVSYKAFEQRFARRNERYGSESSTEA